jgi:hypothetical protein
VRFKLSQHDSPIPGHHVSIAVARALAIASCSTSTAVPRYIPPGSLGLEATFSSERKALDYQDGCINASEFNVLMV